MTELHLKTMSDPLQPISDEQVPLLLEVIQKELPLSIVAFYWIQYQMQWKSKIPNMQVDILCPNGDWKTGVVVGLAKKLERGDKMYAMIYSPESQVQLFDKVLHLTKRIPWEKISVIRGALMYNLAGIKKAVVKCTGRAPKDCHVTLHYLPAHQAAMITPTKQFTSDELQVRRLEPENLDDVCSLWPHYVESYRDVVLAMIKHNLTSGVFVGQRLVSMALQAEYGGLGLLQTAPEFRNRGYGTHVLQILTRDIGRAGVSPYLYVLEENKLALRLIEKVGYQFVSKINLLAINLEETEHN